MKKTDNLFLTAKRRGERMKSSMRIDVDLSVIGLETKIIEFQMKQEEARLNCADGLASTYANAILDLGYLLETAKQLQEEIE